MERAEYERMNATEDHMWWYRAAHQRLLDAWRAHPGPAAAALLDAGCGTGGLLRRLAAASGSAAPGGRAPGGAAIGGEATGGEVSGGEVSGGRGAWPVPVLVGLDVHPPALALAARKCPAALVVGSANRLPFRAASFGVIFSVDVLCHRQVDPRAALLEARRCLADGGRLIINVPAFEWMLSFHDERVHNARRFSRAGLERLLAEAGFGTVTTRYWNCLLFPLMALRRKWGPAPESGSDVADYGGLLDRLFAGLLALERAGARLGLRYPFGGSLLAVATR